VTKRMPFYFSLLMLMVLGSAAPGWAAEAPEVGQTVITSGELTYDYKRSIAIFQDDVVVQDPQVRMESDMLTVLFGSTNDIKSVTAVGNVRLRSGDKRASCNKAIYIARTGEILLSGKAILMRETDRLEGKQITFWLNEERVICKPGRLVIHSAKNRSGGNVLDAVRGKKPAQSPAAP
jgi:lipopolysaccharide export system protein LptA